MTDLSILLAAQAKLARDIENAPRPDRYRRATAGQMAKYRAKIEAMKTELRTVCNAIGEAKAEMVQAPAAREFPNDIANRQTAAMWKAAQQRQLDGLLSSCGR